MRLLRLFVVFLCAVLLLSGCAKKPPAGGTGTPAPPAELVESDTQETEAPSGVYSKEQGPRFDLPESEIERFSRFVNPFHSFPQEFSDVSELSDETMLYSAAAAMGPSFIPNPDDLSASVALEEVERKVREYFGEGAALSSGYREKDYAPFVIDRENGLLVHLFAGSMGGYYYPYALIKDEEGYLFYQLDLMDPLFWDDLENQDLVMSGAEIDYALLEGIAPEMQMNIYRIAETNGRLSLRGFRYENEKDIVHMMF